MANLNLPKNIESLCGPEKLVICVDSACLTHEFRTILRHFIELKTMVNRHEIALVVLNNNDVNFSCEFQTDARTALQQFWNRERYSGGQQKQTFDLSKVFSHVYQMASQYRHKAISLRIIILYARVDCVPIVEVESPLNALYRDFPHFTLDFLYMPQYSSNCSAARKRAEYEKSVEIFQSFIGISNAKSYVFVVEPLDRINLAPCMLKFLAHPALREDQKQN